MGTATDEKIRMGKRDLDKTCAHTFAAPTIPYCSNRKISAFTNASEEGLDQWPANREAIPVEEWPKHQKTFDKADSFPTSVEEIKITLGTSVHSVKPGSIFVGCSLHVEKG